MCVCVCVCVVWHPASITLPNHEVVELQPQAVDIPDLVYVQLPQYMFKPPYVEDACQRRDETNEGQIMGPFNLGTLYSDYCLIPKRYERK